jgi:hypothetical protein
MKKEKPPTAKEIRELARAYVAPFIEELREKARNGKTKQERDEARKMLTSRGIKVD